VYLLADGAGGIASLEADCDRVLMIHRTRLLPAAHLGDAPRTPSQLLFRWRFPRSGWF
jgi:hypothetical protein